MVAALGLLTACDPSKDDISTPGNSSLTSEQLANGFSVVQYSDETYTTQAPDGNYFTFTTSPSRMVTVYQEDEDGNRNVLVSGVANGKFKIVPKRGNPTLQTYFVETRDFNGNTITAKLSAEVFVPSELEPAVRLLASDVYGEKTWTWAEDITDGKVFGSWGNFGYRASDGEGTANSNNMGGGCWWACPAADLVGQLGHSDTGVATGEEDPNAYMVFYEDGSIKTFTAGGNQIRSGKFSVEGYTGERDADGWSLGTLNTTAGSILWPFQINASSDVHDGIVCPTKFEIIKLTSSSLLLTYPNKNNAGWTEATFWSFKSNTDGEGMLSNNGEKAWTWAEDITDGKVFGSWGNFGYRASDGEGTANSNNMGGGCWWACPAAELVGQLGHSDTGVATGEEDPNAYMVVNSTTGKITSYTASGTQIRQGNYELVYNGGKRDDDGWSLGTLKTTAGTILWPFQINASSDAHDGIVCPTEFEVIKLSDSELLLTYPNKNYAGWTEATFWSFKKK